MDTLRWNIQFYHERAKQLHKAEFMQAHSVPASQDETISFDDRPWG